MLDLGQIDPGRRLYLGMQTWPRGLGCGPSKSKVAIVDASSSSASGVTSMPWSISQLSKYFRPVHSSHSLGLDPGPTGPGRSLPQRQSRSLAAVRLPQFLKPQCPALTPRPRLAIHIGPAHTMPQPCNRTATTTTVERILKRLHRPCKTSASE